MKNFTLELDCTQIYTGQSVTIDVVAESEDEARDSVYEGFAVTQDGSELWDIRIVSIEEISSN